MRFLAWVLRGRDVAIASTMIATVEHRRQMAPTAEQFLERRGRAGRAAGRPPAEGDQPVAAHDAGAPTRGTVALLPSVSGVLRVLRALDDAVDLRLRDRAQRVLRLH